ncbi:MAG: tRNA pseudouridine(38-40) synthase TruA [Eubacteriales bacterium]
MKNYRMDLAYDGTRYQGWQRLKPQDATIQGKLEDALSRILEQPVEISGSGRTDGGVHAKNQVANFHVETDMTPQQMLAQLRHYLPGDIGVLDLQEAVPRFHARLSAVEKTYVYRVWNSPAPNVFQRKYVHQLPATLDVEAMKLAAKNLCGTHDFRSFCSNRKMKKSTVRTIHSLDIRCDGYEVDFVVRGDGFLHHMVRILVGTLLEVGLGKRDALSMADILSAKKREMAGETAPACGLILQEVVYP